MKQTFEWLKLKFSNDAIIKIYTENPLLFTVDFANFFIKKYKTLRKLKLKYKDIDKILLTYPQIFIRFVTVLIADHWTPCMSS